MPTFESRPLRCLVLDILLMGTPGIACHDAPGPAEAATTTGGSTLPEDPTATMDAPTTAPDDEKSTTSAGSTTAAPSDTDATSTGLDTDTGGPLCGNGVMDGEEECDDGVTGNDDSRFCKADCTLNICGDGDLFVGWELCDEGTANSDEYGSLCGAQCKPASRCGDHIVQPAFETCDLGLDNGGLIGDEQGILCDASCRAQQLRAFVTNDAFDGNLGGLFGADLKCEAAASAAGLADPKRFHAYLSTGKVDAKDRFAEVPVALPYVFVTGKKFASSFAALSQDGPLGEGISVAETGVTLYKKLVATNTAPGGLSFSPDQDCQGWTSADGAFWARVGLNALPAKAPDADAWKTEMWWTGVSSWRCDKVSLHLYCLEI